MFWVHTGRTRIEDLSLINFFYFIQLTLFFKNIKVDRHRIMHDVCIILTCENKTCTTHISGKLIDLIKGFKKLIYDLCVEVTSFTCITNHTPNKTRISEITLNKLISFSLTILGSF